MAPTALHAIDPGGNCPLGVIAIQEVKRSVAGWTDDQVGKWSLLSHQTEDEWRGTGILYDSSSFAVLRRKASSRGTWFRLRHLSTGQEIWIGSIYLPPHLNTLDMQGHLIEHCDVLPPTTLPVYLSGDANARLLWEQDAHGIFPYGHDSKSKVLIDTLKCYDFHLVTPAEGQRYTPTSRPRKEGTEGNVIDWVACKRGDCSHVKVEVDSCRQIGADHDCLIVHLCMRTHRQRRPRIQTGPRRVMTTPTLGLSMDQPTLRRMAKECTQRPKKPRYRDSHITKELFRIAKQAKGAYAWKRALRARHDDYHKWKLQRVENAMNGDWSSLRECRPVAHKGWEARLAENLAPADPHQALHDHYAAIFKGESKPTKTCSSRPLPSPDITAHELEEALKLGKKGRSVGHDGVSHELLIAISEMPGGTDQLLAWYNYILHSGDIPKDWNQSLMVLLPKLRNPRSPKDTRPIAMGCSAEKLFCRIILRRCDNCFQLRRPWQCAAPRRQTCDYLFTMHRICELEREWSKGLCILKIDFRRAFDSINRKVLLGRLRTRLGDSEEFRIWETIMLDTSCILRSPWNQTNFETSRGIRQGAIESPAMFGCLVEWVLEDIENAKLSPSPVSTYNDLGLTQAAFMDDLLIWDGTMAQVKMRFLDLKQAFHAWGLDINVEKCSIYVSPKHKGNAVLNVEGVTLEAQPVVEVMGIPFKVGANAQELLQGTWQRGRDKFWALKHLFLSDTPIKGRIKMLDSIIGGTVLWNIAAFAPELSGLMALNHLLFQLILWMLKLKKPAREAWVEFRKRGLRQARQLACAHLSERWSTRWLARYWGFMGHTARGASLDSPPCSSIMVHYRPLEWWQEQQLLSTGLRHTGRFRAKLSTLDKRLNQAAGGVWRQVAQDRTLWKTRTQQWILHNDVPWASGSQFAIEW